MTRNEIKAARAAEIMALCKRGAENPTSLYNRLVRYALRYFRHGEKVANGIRTEWERELEAHEFVLLAGLEGRLAKELDELGLEFEYPGLWPLVIEKGTREHVLWLFHY
jgi:hypothetical protein